MGKVIGFWEDRYLKARDECDALRAHNTRLEAVRVAGGALLVMCDEHADCCSHGAQLVDGMDAYRKAVAMLDGEGIRDL